MTLTEVAQKLAGVKPEELTVVKVPYAGKETPDGQHSVAADDLSIPEFCKIPKEQRGANDTKEAGKSTKARAASGKAAGANKAPKAIPLAVNAKERTTEPRKG